MPALEAWPVHREDFAFTYMFYTVLSLQSPFPAGYCRDNENKANGCRGRVRMQGLPQAAAGARRKLLKHSQTHRVKRMGVQLLVLPNVAAAVRYT